MAQKEFGVTADRLGAVAIAAQVGDDNGFYGDLLGLRVVMDQGWTVRFAADNIAVCREHYVTGSPITGSTEKLYLQICLPL
jgi:hypothetical protein